MSGLPDEAVEGTRLLHKASGEVWEVVTGLTNERVRIAPLYAGRPVHERGRWVWLAYLTNESSWERATALSATDTEGE